MKKYIDNPSRLLNRHELEKELEKTLSKKTRSEWIDILDKSGVPSGPIYDMKEVWNDPQVKFRNMRVKLKHEKVGETDNIGVIAKFSEKPSSLRTPSPLLGEHTDEISAEIGLSDQEILDAKEEKAV